MCQNQNLIPPQHSLRRIKSSSYLNKKIEFQRKSYKVTKFYHMLRTTRLYRLWTALCEELHECGLFTVNLGIGTCQAYAKRSKVLRMYTFGILGQLGYAKAPTNKRLWLLLLAPIILKISQGIPCPSNIHYM